MTVQQDLAAVAVGSALYWGVFHRGEHFLYPQRYIQMALLTILAGAVFLANTASLPFKAAIFQSFSLVSIAIAAIYANCIAFRLFMNPLNKIPGPYGARISKFDHTFRNLGMDAHIQLLKQHEKYNSKYVRIGPNDISVTDADATEVISSPKSTCIKGPWYAQDQPLISLHTTRDRAAHDRRRRIWAPAFSDKALRGYEARVQGLNNLLLTKLGEAKGQPVNSTRLFNLYSFDVMGDLAFGKDFGGLASGETHWAINLLNEGMDPLGVQMPHWFFRLLTAIPGLAAGYWKFIGFTTQQLENRVAVHDKTDPEKPDITNALIDHYNQSPNKKEIWPMLSGDSRLIIVAGSDTTAATLTYLFYHVASKPEWQQKLREEVQQIRAKAEHNERAIPDNLLKDAPILNGMINETLRLNPPVPSGVFRRTPSEGVMIGNTFIPGNTNIQMPQYVMSRSEDNFAQPLEFIPERWSTKPELIKHKDAFTPFASGPFGCIGKNLAYMEIRTIASQIVEQFDVELAAGEDGQDLLMKTVDHFTLGLKPLMLVFKQR